MDRTVIVAFTSSQSDSQSFGDGRLAEQLSTLDGYLDVWAAVSSCRPPLALPGLDHQRADAGAGVLDLDVEIAGLVRREGVGDGIPGLLNAEDDVVAVHVDLFLLVRRHPDGDPIALMDGDRGRLHRGTG